MLPDKARGSWGLSGICLFSEGIVWTCVGHVVSRGTLPYRRNGQYTLPGVGGGGAGMLIRLYFITSSLVWSGRKRQDMSILDRGRGDSVYLLLLKPNPHPRLHWFILSSSPSFHHNHKSLFSSNIELTSLHCNHFLGIYSISTHVIIGWRSMTIAISVPCFLSYTLWIVPCGKTKENWQKLLKIHLSSLGSGFLFFTSLKTSSIALGPVEGRNISLMNYVEEKLLKVWILELWIYGFSYWPLWYTLGRCREWFLKICS